MNEDDLALRNLTYARLVELGRAPTAAEIAAAGSGRGRAEVMAGWERLHAEHALVLDPATGEITMAHPFSGVPTAYRGRRRRGHLLQMVALTSVRDGELWRSYPEANRNDIPLWMCVG